LRKKAQDNKAAFIDEQAKLAATNLQVSTAQWPEAVATMSDQLLTALKTLNVKRVYLAGVYAFEEPKYSANAELTDKVRKQLALLDKEGRLFDPKNIPDYKLTQEAGKLVLTSAGRTVTPPTSKTAIIVGEVLYEAQGQGKGYATVSLRAVDLSNFRVLANQVMMLSVEPTLGKLLDLPKLKVPAKREAPVTATSTAAASAGSASTSAASTTAASTTTSTASTQPAAEAPPLAVMVNLKDDGNYLGKAKKSSGSYGFTTAGPADTLANRFAILMLKSYFLDKQTDVKISDEDFLKMVLPAFDKPVDQATLPTDVSGLWVAPNVAALSEAIGLNPLKVRELSGGEVNVGPVEMKRDLPKLSLPSATDLRDGGYTD